MNYRMAFNSFNHTFKSIHMLYLTRNMDVSTYSKGAFRVLCGSI